LFSKLCVAGAELLSSTIKGLENGSITPQKQSEAEISYAPMLTKEMGLLDFNKTATELWYLIRGFNPWPLTYFYCNERRFKVYDAEPFNVSGHISGEFFIKDGKAYIGCAENTALMLKEICPDGSKKMDSAAFINGRFISEGQNLINQE